MTHIWLTRASHCIRSMWSSRRLHNDSIGGRSVRHGGGGG